MSFEQAVQNRKCRNKRIEEYGLDEAGLEVEVNGGAIRGTTAGIDPAGPSVEIRPHGTHRTVMCDPLQVVVK